MHDLVNLLARWGHIRDLGRRHELRGWGAKLGRSLTAWPSPRVRIRQIRLLDELRFDVVVRQLHGFLTGAKTQGQADKNHISHVYLLT
jgi:hypothetical protein